MRVSLVNLNLNAGDAIGGCVINQARYFVQRGDQVKIYIEHPPAGVSADIKPLCQIVTLADLLRKRDEHFAASDLYVYHYPMRYALMESMAGIERGAVIFYYHNVTPPHLWGSAFEREALQHSLNSVSVFVAYADLIVTDSDFNVEQLVRDHGCSPDQVLALPLGVPLEQFAPGPAAPELRRRYRLEGKRVILFVGRMAGNKRIEMLVEVLAIVRRTIPSAVLLLVGDDRGNPAIQETVGRAKVRAEALGVSDAVIFTGPVEDLSPYYHLAEVYATASQHEGFGLPLVEAMASGVPVVASRTTTHPWLLGEAGLLADPNSTADLAAQIERVLNDADLCNGLINRGLTRSHDFSLAQYMAGWAAIVDRVTTWLPERARQPSPEPKTTLPSGDKRFVPSLSRLTAELQLLEDNCDVMLRGYVVRSHLSLLGPLIAWVRRNLTYHLREMYLDPMFERQVAFNHQVTRLMRHVVNQSAVATREQQRLEEHLRRVKTGLDVITDQLILARSSASPGVLPEQAAELQRQLEALRATLHAPELDD